MSASAELPALSYALAVFRREELLRVPLWLENLRELGFRWVTLMPTYLVPDEIPLRIDFHRSPPAEEVSDAILRSAEAGFHVKLEPHLDWETTLTGGTYEWRRRMYVDPVGEYADELIAPLLPALKAAAAGGAHCALTVGSELDVSLVEFPVHWRRLAQVLQGTHPEIAVGHNINHDSLNSSTDIRKPLNAERARRGLAEIDWREHHERVEATHRYLGSLDYTGFSFYPDARARRSLEWWRAQTTPLHVRVVGRALQGEAQVLVSRLRRAAGDRPQFAIGEFGIGCTDPSRPWHFDFRTFLRPDGQMDAGAKELRRKYYLGMLEALRHAPELFGPHPVTFWSVTHYDFLGALEYPEYDVFRDAILREAVRAYNEGRQ